MRILCVAEKPSISKSVAQTLSGGSVRTRSSKSKYIKNYDFTFNFATIGQCNVTMTAVVGHLTSFDFPAAYGWGKCSPGKLFEAPIEEKIAKKDVFANIGIEASNADYLMIWTDCDREGEYIGFEILQAARKRNQRLNLDNVLRAQFSHLEKSHIIRAASNPIKLDPNAIDAVKTRMMIDLRTGASFTRFLSNLFKSTFRDRFEHNQIISYGSCQFPTLGFIVDRYKRVKEFIPEPFWLLDIQVTKEEQKVGFNWSRGHVFDRLFAVLIYEDCMESGEGKIEDIVEKPTSNYRPLPLTTVELQKNCSRFLRISGKQALDSAESLYNKGFVSYPRTETDQFPKTMDLHALVDKQTQSTAWGEHAMGLKNGKFKQPRAGRHDDKAHPPIHPVTYCGGGQGLSVTDMKVYEYITRHFLACCSEDAKGNQTTISLKWGEEMFSAGGLVVTERNYLDVFPYHKWETSETLPKFEKGEVVKLTSAELKESKTSPPKYVTEAELIALMDANGIGTDATIAEHINKITTREYIIKKAQGRGQAVFVPSELGMALVDGFDNLGFDNMSLTKPFLRKSLEGHLTDISEGRNTSVVVLENMVEMYSQAFATANQKQNVLTQAFQNVLEENRES